MARKTAKTAKTAKTGKTTDPVVETILRVLDRYKLDHPRARVDAYRSNPASIRLRIVDPDFGEMSRTQRDDLIWTYLDALDDETVAEINLLILLAPEETKKSPANLEFENPSPWMY